MFDSVVSYYHHSTDTQVRPVFDWQIHVARTLTPTPKEMGSLILNLAPIMLQHRRRIKALTALLRFVVACTHIHNELNRWRFTATAMQPSVIITAATRYYYLRYSSPGVTISEVNWTCGIHRGKHDSLHANYYYRCCCRSFRSFCIAPTDHVTKQAPVYGPSTLFMQLTAGPRTAYTA